MLTEDPVKMAALRDMAQRLADRWGEPSLLILSSCQVFPWSYANTIAYACLESVANEQEKAVGERFVPQQQALLAWHASHPRSIHVEAENDGIVEGSR